MSASDPRVSDRGLQPVNLRPIQAVRTKRLTADAGDPGLQLGLSRAGHCCRLSTSTSRDCVIAESLISRAQSRLSFAGPSLRIKRACKQGLHPGQNQTFHHTGWINGLVPSPPAAPTTGFVQRGPVDRLMAVRPCRLGTVVTQPAHPESWAVSPGAPCCLPVRDPLVQDVAPSPPQGVKRHQQDPQPMLR